MNRVNSERVGESFSQRFQRSSVFPFSNPGLLQPWGTRLSTVSTLKELANRLANAFSVRTSFLFQTQLLQPWETRLSTVSTLKELANRLANAFSVRASFLFQTQGCHQPWAVTRERLRRWYYVLANRLRRLLPLTNPASALVHLKPTFGVGTLANPPSVLTLFFGGRSGGPQFSFACRRKNIGGG